MWAIEGDLVFVLGKDNIELVPCKIVKILGTGRSTQFFFEPIVDEDMVKISKKRLKAYATEVGYSGGFVFKEKQNGLDYLESVKNKGGFSIGSTIAKKAKEKLNKKTQHMNIQKIKNDAMQSTIQSTINRVHKVIIAAMLIALNSKLKIGPKRGAELVAEINHLIETEDPMNLIKMAEDKMKIKLGDE